MNRLARAADAVLDGTLEVTDMVTGTPWLMAFYHEGHWYRLSIEPAEREEIDELFGAEDDRFENQPEEVL